MPLEHAILRCGVCRIPEKHFPDFDTAAREPAEYVDELIDLAIDQGGWHAADLGWRRMAICDACAKYIADRNAVGTEPLPDFSEEACCPKCGAKTSMKYCDGLNVACRRGAADEHLHRLCERCGFEFYMKVKA